MRLGQIAALATAAGLALAAVASAEEEGVERWPVKVMPPLAQPVEVVPIETLLALPDVPGVGHNDARFQNVRLPTWSVYPMGRPCPAAMPGCHAADGEGSPVSTTGWLQLVAFEDDGDFHIQISAAPDKPSPCLIVEVPDPKFIPDLALRAQAQQVRAWIVSQIFAGKTPAPAGTVLKRPVKVTVTGAIFYDDAHVGTPARGKRGMKAGSLWELHPVTGISLAP